MLLVFNATFNNIKAYLLKKPREPAKTTDIQTL